MKKILTWKISNTEERKNAANSFERDFFKFMISSVYAKIMENLKKESKWD